MQRNALTLCAFPPICVEFDSRASDQGRLAKLPRATHAAEIMDSHEVMKEVLKRTSAKQIAADMGLSLSLIYWSVSLTTMSVEPMMAIESATSVPGISSSSTARLVNDGPRTRTRIAILPPSETT